MSFSSGLLINQEVSYTRIYIIFTFSGRDRHQSKSGIDFMENAAGTKSIILFWAIVDFLESTKARVSPMQAFTHIESKLKKIYFILMIEKNYEWKFIHSHSLLGNASLRKAKELAEFPVIILLRRTNPFKSVHHIEIFITWYTR